MLSLPNEGKNQERMWLRDDQSVWLSYLGSFFFTIELLYICMYACARSSEIGMLFDLNRPMN